MENTTTGGQFDSYPSHSGMNAASRLEMAEAKSVSSRKSSRDSLHADIEAFLASGGKIQMVEAGVTAERDEE